MAGINPNDPRSPYLQIADDLRSAIKDGRLKPGQRLTSTRELAALYGVAPMTVHQAMRVLRDEHLVVSHQGRGVFVTASDGTASEDHASGTEHQLEILTARVDEIGALVRRADVHQPDLDDLRREVGELRAQLIELYARTGHQYPRDQSSRSAGTTPASRRKASGS